MAFEFEAVSIEEAQATLSRRTRTSKWREAIQSFVDADVPAGRIKLDDDQKPGSVASGLNQALTAAKDGGSEFPVKVKQTTAVDGTKSVYLVRTDLMPEASSNGSGEDEE